MNRIATPSAANLWRVVAIGALGALIAMIALSPADAGQTKTKVLKPTKVVIAEGEVGSGNGADDDTVARCPTGWLATGGGVDFGEDDPDVTVPYNGPLVQNDNLVAASPGLNPPAKAWRVHVENNDTGSYTYSVGVICSKPVKVIN